MFLVASLRQAIKQQQKEGKVILVPVSKWKGTVKKHITQRRLRRPLPPHYAKIPLSALENHNEADAIGIAKYYSEKRNTQNTQNTKKRG